MSLLIGEVFRRAATTSPNCVAASLGEHSLTFGEVDDASNRIGDALQGQGLAPGDRVAWWGGTTLDVIPLFAALAKLGAVFTPLDVAFSAEEAAPVLTKARPRLLVVDASHVEPGQVVADATGVALTRLGGEEASEGPALAEAAWRGTTRQVSEPTLREDDPHVIFFTGGRTGEPKGVVLSHRANFLRTFPGTASSIVGPTVCMFPLFHMAAWSIALSCWQARQEVVFVARPDAGSLLAAVDARRARRLYATNAAWTAVLAADRSPYDLSCLVEANTGTSATPPELVVAIRKAFPNASTRVMYGSTEAGPGTVLYPDDLERKPGRVGLPNPGVEVKLSDDGEVLVRSAFLMSGYFEDLAATATALADGWYHTGDVGSFDDEGYLSIVGSLHDVIRTGGDTVAPAEVEAALASHPAVEEVVVVGVPDPAGDEAVCAVIVPRPGAQLSLDDLRQHAEQHLAPHKQPRRLELVEAFPRTAETGLVQRTLIAERLAAVPVPALSLAE